MLQVLLLQVEPGTLTSITGWGKIYDGSSAISPTLQMVSNSPGTLEHLHLKVILLPLLQVHDLPTITNEDCDLVYGEWGIVGPGVVCVDTKGGHGSCHVSYGASSASLTIMILRAS